MNAPQRRTNINLDTPRPRRRIFVGVHYDPDRFGKFSEATARFIGTARFLVWQTFVCLGWIVWNLYAPADWQFDPYGRGLVLLTFVLSLQAAYAAPLILLAQNRQAERDRMSTDRDSNNMIRSLEDTAFLARELASIRFALSDVVTSEELSRVIEQLVSEARNSDNQNFEGGADRRRHGRGRRETDSE